MTILDRAARAAASADINSKSLGFAQLAAAMAVAARQSTYVHEVFAKKYPRSVYLPVVQEYAKAAVAAGATTGAWGGDLTVPATLGAAFVQALRPLTVLGRLAGARHVPINTKIQRATSGASAGWVGEKKPVAASELVLDTITLDPFKIAGLIFATRELVELSTPEAAGLLRDDLLAAVASYEDRALLDPTAVAQAGISPASITSSGPVQIPSAGTSAENAVDDMRRLVEGLYGSNLISPYFIMTPRLAARMSALRLTSGGGFAFPGASARHRARLPACRRHRRDDPPSRLSPLVIRVYRIAQVEAKANTSK